MRLNSTPDTQRRRYFIVKHGLDAFWALPGFIWRSDLPRSEPPAKFKQVRLGDRWVEFAYVKDENDFKPSSLVVGFYECTREAWYGDVPLDRRTEHWDDDWPTKAWMIEGTPWGEQWGEPVSVPPINAILERTVFGRGAIIPGLSVKDLERVRRESLKRHLCPTKIPLLGREPLNEQEVLAVVVSGHKQLGIDKILKVQTAFPDMLAQVNGKEVHLELEVDSLGFWHHWDDLRRVSGRRNVRQARLVDEDDDRPVAILCWVDGDRSHELRRSVRQLRVFELQKLLREGRKIVW